MAQTISLNQGVAPHLKGEAPLIPGAAREIAAALILLSAGVWCGGVNTALFFSTVLAVTLICEVFLRFAGFSAALKPDATLFQQTVLLVLFLPAHLPLNLVALSAFAITLIYRISGGRAGMVLPPVCLALAVVSLLKYELHFVLNALPLISALIVFGLGFLLRFPRTLIEFEKWVSILIFAGVMAGLHSMPIGTALLWSVVAGEILFDSTLMPLGKSLRLSYRLIVLLFALFITVISTPEETLLFSGLVAGFIAAFMERRVYVGKYYGKA